MYDLLFLEIFIWNTHLCVGSWFVFNNIAFCLIKNLLITFLRFSEVCRTYMLALGWATGNEIACAYTVHTRGLGMVVGWKFEVIRRLKCSDVKEWKHYKPLSGYSRGLIVTAFGWKFVFDNRNSRGAMLLCTKRAHFSSRKPGLKHMILGTRGF